MGKILVVEDDLDLSEQVSLWLEGESHDVDVANDGLTAIKRLSEDQYDVLVLDWDLPGKRGVDICKEYRDNGGLGGVLMVTGRGEKNEKVLGLDCGADDYMTKPFDIEELAARVRALMRRVERVSKPAAKKEPPKITETMVCPQCGLSFLPGAEKCTECGSELKLRIIDNNIGTTIAGKYEIMSALAHGGIASVYLGRQKLMKRTVAIKLLHNTGLKSETHLKRFQREAEASARLEHPNIAAVYDFGLTEDDLPYLIMSYVNGHDLMEVLEAEQYLDWRRALNIFRQVCAGLSHAHQQGVIHRDLKPANIMIERLGQPNEWVKLVDFGIAKLRPVHGDEVERLTRDGDIFGTVHYMSPEQCRGQEPDERSDIYSLGCVFYETVTGLPPVRGNNILEIIQEHLDATPTGMRALRPDLNLPERLEQIVHKCMDKEPSRRFQTVAEVLAALS